MVRLFFYRFDDVSKLFILYLKGVKTMKEEKYYSYLNNDEIKIIVRSLIILRNKLLNQQRYTDYVDDIIVKILKTYFKSHYLP